MKNVEHFFLGIRVAAWVEIICFFILILLIAIFTGTEINFFGFNPHPFWIVVILISAQYGTLAGLLAALVSTGIYLAGPLPKQTLLQEWSQYFFQLTKLPLLWFVSALILGELRMKHIRERDRLRILALEAEERERGLAESYEALKRLKERLEYRVATQMPTTLMVIEAYKKLEESEKSNLLKNTCELIKVMISPDKFSIFFKKEDRLEIAQQEGWKATDHYMKTFSSETALYQEIIEKKRVLSLNAQDVLILNSEGILAVPILSSPESPAMGMIKIEEMPFQGLKLSTIESLRLIATSLGKAYER